MSNQGLDLPFPPSPSLTPAKWHDVMSLPVIMPCWVRGELITSAHIYSNYGTSVRYIFTLSVFGFNFTILVNVKMHQRKMSVCGEMIVCELRVTPAEVKALSVKAGWRLLFHYCIPVTHCTPAQVTDACSGVLNKPKKRTQDMIHASR